MIDLRALQLQAEAEFTVSNTRRLLNELVQFFKEHEIYQEAMEVIMVQERRLPMQIALECDCFFVPDDMLAVEVPEQFHHESLGFMRGNRLIFGGRLVYPVKDTTGDVMGLCGWDNAEKPKYLDSKNHGYKAKESTLYGMEKLPEYYASKKPVFVVEGIVCCNYLRSKGFQALALLGSNISPYVRHILNRFGSRLIVIPDNDFVKDLDSTSLSHEALSKDTNTAGESLVRKCIKQLPKAFVMQTRSRKDIDDTRKEFEENLLKDLNMLNICPAYFNLLELRRRR